MRHVLKYSDIKSKILKSSFEVHNMLGLGYKEVVCQRAKALVLIRLVLNYVVEKLNIIYYKYPVGNWRADLIVERKVVVELKARSTVEDAHKARVLNYYKVFNHEVGLLHNVTPNASTIWDLSVPPPTFNTHLLHPFQRENLPTSKLNTKTVHPCRMRQIGLYNLIINT